MTQEEKQLLLQEICARLPYGVQYKDAHGYKKTIDIWSPEFHTALNTILYDGKPSLYLRPLSSMTEEEKEEYNYMVFDYEYDDYWYPGKYIDAICVDGVDELVDWFNSHHFDYRGLIPMGLALPAPEDMYSTKTE